MEEREYLIDFPGEYNGTKIASWLTFWLAAFLIWLAFFAGCGIQFLIASLLAYIASIMLYDRYLRQLKPDDDLS